VGGALELSQVSLLPLVVALVLLFSTAVGVFLGFILLEEAGQT